MQLYKIDLRTRDLTQLVEKLHTIQIVHNFQALYKWAWWHRNAVVLN